MLKFVLTEKFNQDVAEEYFGEQGQFVNQNNNLKF